MKSRNHGIKRMFCLILSILLVVCCLSDRTYAATSKKGLQGIESAGLGTKHSLYNLDVAQYINTSGGSGYATLGNFSTGSGTRTYYINVVALTNLAKKFKDTKKNTELETISLVLTSRKLQGLTDMTESSSTFHAFNTWTEEGLKLTKSLFNIIAGLFGSAADYFVMQNEINNPHEWMEMGERTIDEFVTYYEKACHLLNDELKATGAKGKVMISIDYFWNVNDNGRFNAMDLLTLFAEKAKAGGDYDWGIANHSYPAPLDDADFTDDYKVGVKKEESSFIVSMYNIEVMIDFMKKEQFLYNGKIRSIVVAECGFNAMSNGAVDEEKQAAMYAYAYYKMEATPEIEAFLTRAYIDLSPEPEQGLFFGMYDLSWHPREILDLMKYIDTKQGTLLTNKYLKYFNVSSWEELVPGFSDISLSQSKFAVGLDCNDGYSLGGGQSTTWTATADGGTAPYQYRLVYVDASYKETVLSNFSTNNTWTLPVPITSDSHVRVDVKDANGKTTSRMVWVKYNKAKDVTLFGDVNNDKSWDAIDAAMIGAHIMKRTILTGDEFYRADINGDGVVDAIDIAYIGAYIMRRAETVPQRETEN